MSQIDIFSSTGNNKGDSARGFGKRCEAEQTKLARERDHLFQELKGEIFQMPANDVKRFNDFLDCVRKERQEHETIETDVESISSSSVKLFDMDIVKQRLENLGKSDRKKDERDLLKKMIQQGGGVHLRPLPANWSDIMDEMDSRYPHFSDVTQFLRQRMALLQVQENPLLCFGVNILLDGPAGVGKSSYLMALSESIDTKFATISCAASSNGFDLTGLSSGWGTGRPGKLHETLFNQECPNPILLLDEVEKAIGDEKSNITGALFGLLEKNNARSFKDEFIDVEMDASHINWFATSNNASRLDPAIKDRFVVLKVEAPDKHQLRQIIPILYDELLAQLGLQKVFSPRLPDEVTKDLAASGGISIRAAKTMLEQALSNAVTRLGEKKTNNIELMQRDIPPLEDTDGQDNHVERRPIGFIWN